MSFILDALRKAEQDRLHVRGPKLGQVRPQPAGRRARIWPWVIAVGLGANALVLGWWITASDRGSPGMADPPEARVAGSAITPPPEAPPPAAIKDQGKALGVAPEQPRPGAPPAAPSAPAGQDLTPRPVPPAAPTPEPARTTPQTPTTSRRPVELPPRGIAGAPGTSPRSTVREGTPAAVRPPTGALAPDSPQVSQPVPEGSTAGPRPPAAARTAAPPSASSPTGPPTIALQPPDTRVARPLSAAPPVESKRGPARPSVPEPPGAGPGGVTAPAAPAAEPATSPAAGDPSARAPRARLNVPGVVSPAAPAARPRTAREGLPPTLEEMPQEFRASVPKLRIDVLVYSEAGGDPLVFINGRKYVAGQSVEGLTLEAIRQEGVVLNHRGERFLLRARQ